MVEKGEKETDKTAKKRTNELSLAVSLSRNSKRRLAVAVGLHDGERCGPGVERRWSFGNNLWMSRTFQLRHNSHPPRLRVTPHTRQPKMETTPTLLGVM